VDAIPAEALDALAGRLRAYLREPADDCSTPEPLLTVHEAAQRARAHPETIRRAIRSGALHAVRAGRSLRIAPGDLDAWLQRSAARTRPAPPRRTPASGMRRQPLAGALAALEHIRDSV
jgi:excisionase family DNA binding protein